MKTMRGLEGAAERGHSTGGLPLGYGSRPIWGDNKREPIGHEIVVDDEDAELVRRIFRLYAEGRSYLGIAKLLNDEGVTTPRHTKKGRRKGWVASTIREVLRNEAYVGRWTYAKRHWRKLPGTNKRRYRVRPAEQVKNYDRPHLRIIDEELWQRVAARLAQVAAKYKGKGASGAPGRRTSFPLSGLLVCSQCGAPMVITGGSHGRYYRCGDAHKRGNCPNRTPVREAIVTKAVIDHMVAVLRSQDMAADLREHAEIAAKEAASRATTDEIRLTKDLKRVEVEVERLLAFITTLDPTTGSAAYAPVAAKLDATTKQKAVLDAQLAAVRSGKATGPRVPTTDDLQRTADDFEKELRDDPVALREVLRVMTADGKIMLEPQADGSYIARSFFLLLEVPRGKPTARKAQGPETMKASGPHRLPATTGYTAMVARDGFEPSTFGL